MTDTVRTIAALQTLLADSQPAGSITPQVMRDMLVSLDPLNSTVAFSRLTSLPTTSAGHGIAKLYDGGGGFFDVLHPTYGAVGDGSTDDTTAITAAITAANSAGGGIVRFGHGTYKITSTLQGKYGVTLQGLKGAASNAGDVSRLQWNGTGGGTMLNYGAPDNVGQNLQGTPIRDLTFYGANSGTVDASRAGHAITYSFNQDTTTMRVDFFSDIEGCSFQRFGGDAIQYNSSGTNIHIRRCRWDHVSGYAVYVADKTGAWTGSISTVTWDTGTETETNPKGFLFIDGQSQTDHTTRSRTVVNSARLEVNKQLVGSAAVIALGVDTANTVVVQHYLTCIDVTFDFTTSTVASNCDVVGLIGTASDGVDIEMIGCDYNFPEFVRKYVANLTSTWLPPNPSSSFKYHPTHWTCRPFMYGAPGGSDSVTVLGEKIEVRASLIIGGDGASDPNTRNKRGILCLAPVSATPDTPPTNYLHLYNAAGTLSVKNSAGTVKTVNLT